MVCDPFHYEGLVRLWAVLDHYDPLGGSTSFGSILQHDDPWFIEDLLRVPSVIVDFVLILDYLRDRMYSFQFVSMLALVFALAFSSLAIASSYASSSNAL